MTVCLHKQLLFLWFSNAVQRLDTVCHLSAYTSLLPSWLYSALVAPQVLKLRVISVPVKQMTACA